MAFENTPTTNTYTVERQINGKTVVFEFKTEAHHLYPQDVFDDSSTLRAMEAAGLWHHDDFRVNGIQLPSEMRVLSVDGVQTSGSFSNINKFSFTDGDLTLRGEDIVPGSFHRGQHPAFSSLTRQHAAALDEFYDTAKSTGNWGQYANEGEWLAAQRKEVFGFKTELQVLLNHPEIISPLNKPGAGRSGVNPGEFWERVSELAFGSNVDLGIKGSSVFDGKVTSSEAFQLGAASADGYQLAPHNPNSPLTEKQRIQQFELTEGLRSLDATPGQGSPFDLGNPANRTFEGSVQSLQHLGVDVDGGKSWAAQEVGKGYRRLSSAGSAVAALAIAVAVTANLAIMAQEAEAKGLSLREYLEQSLSDVTLDQVKSAMLEAGKGLLADTLINSALGFVGLARKLYDLAMSGEDVLNAIKALDHASDHPVVEALADLARAAEATGIFRAGDIQQAISDWIGGVGSALNDWFNGKLNENEAAKSASELFDGDTGVKSQTGPSAHQFANGEVGTKATTTLNNGTSVTEFRNQSGQVVQRDFHKGPEKLASEFPSASKPGATTIITFDHGQPSEATTVGPDGTSTTTRPPSAGASSVLPKSIEDFLKGLPNVSADNKPKWDWSTSQSLPNGGYTVKDQSGQVERKVEPLPEGGRYRETISGPNGSAEMDWNVPLPARAPQFPPLPERSPFRFEVKDENGNKIGGGETQTNPDGTEEKVLEEWYGSSGQGSPDEWHTSVTTSTPGGNAVIRRTAATTPDGVVMGPWKTEVIPLNQLLRESQGAIIGDGIGQIFGSSLGQALGGGNVFAQIGASSVLGQVLSDLGQALGISLDVGQSLETSIDAGFEKFGSNFAEQVKSASINAVSSFLVAELSAELNLGDNFASQLFSSVTNKVTSTILTNIVNTEAGQAIDLFANLQGLDIAINISSFIGSYLAHEILEPKTTAGAIGGSIGGTLGTAIGLGLAGIETGFLGSLGTSIVAAVGLDGVLAGFGIALDILLPGIGALIGVLLGTVLGDALAPFIEDIWDDWFGNNPPRGDAWVDYNPVTGEFISDPSGHGDRDPRKGSVEIAKVASDLLNVYTQAMGGTVVNGAGNLRRNFYIWTDQNNLFRGPGGNFNNADAVINAGVLAMLKTLQVAGGDIYVKRAIAHTQATTLEELNGDLQIAQDYARYIENKDIIDLLIGADPNSAFSAGWVITLIRAQELGITEWSATDFQGGLASFFEALGLGRLGATPEDLRVTVEGTTLKLQVVIDGETVRTIAIKDFASKIGYQHLAALANGAVVTGTAGDDIWIAANAASTFNDAATANAGRSNDILIGGAQGDAINAGLGWDYVHGNAGDDLIVGGGENDSLYGGDGNDTIYGDANTGFAPIPTGTQLSDGAASGAPIAFNNARHTWLGGVDVEQSSLSHGYVPPAPNFDEDVISGGKGKDQLAGGTGEDLIQGGDGNDTLYGDAGHDFLVGGAGADVIHGGDGFDTASYEDAEQSVTVDLAGAAFNGTASDGDMLYDIEDLVGSRFADFLYGDAYSNLIDGGMGADTIDGRGGRDTISFYSNTHGVDVNMATGLAVTTIPGTNGAAATTVTDTFANIEDVIGSRFNDTLTGSTNGGGLDGGAGDDTIILRNDDADVAGGAGSYEVRGGTGIDTLDFSGWSKPRGVQVDLGGTTGGNRFSGIEKVIGSAQADTIEGGSEAEIFKGGGGNDRFNASGGRDVYLFGRGSGQDLLRHRAQQTGANVTLDAGMGAYPQYTGTAYSSWGDGYSIYDETPVYVRAHYNDVVAIGTLDPATSSQNRPSSHEHQSLVFEGSISYHDIFGALSGPDLSSVNLQYDKYLYGNQPSVDGFGTIGSLQTLTRQQVIDQLGAINLTIGVKAQNSYFNGSSNVLSQLTDTVTVEGGGVLPVESAGEKTWIGISNSYGLTYEAVGGDSETTYWGIVATHQGTRYDFDANNTIERLGFEGSGHIALTGVKYFKDGSAAADALTAATGQGTWLFGGALNDVVTGADKGDVIVGGADNDRLQGGAGDDQYAYWLGDGHDIITDHSGGDVIVFGGGITSGDVKLKVGKLDNPADHTSFRVAAPGEVPVDLRIEIYHPTTGVLVGSISIVDFRNAGSAQDKLRFAGDYEITIFEFLAKQGEASLPTFTGTAGNDTLTGTDAAEVFWGLAGNDTMRGGKGDDVFYAHNGADVIDGGEGNDTIDFRYATGAVNVNLTNERAIEPGNVTDILEGIDYVVGSDYDDTIDGSSWDNVFSGGRGNDTISGVNGKDTLSGGDGNDTISGGNQDDTIYGGRGNDAIDGGANIDTASFADLETGVTVNLLTGTATAQFTSNGTTVTETDTLTNIESVTGTKYADTIIGGAVAGIYDSGGDDDRFVIQSDDVDVAAGAASMTLLGGLGVDTLDFSGWSKARGIEVNLGNVKVDEDGAPQPGDWFGTPIATASTNINLYNGIEKVIGSSLADKVQGTDRAESFIGGAGDDQFAGLGGADALDGGAGIDTANYASSDQGVTVNLATGVGSGGDAQGDTLTSIENVVGSAFGDTITGDTAANVLTGGAGNDVLSGGASNDLLIGSTGSDRLDGGEGIDTADYSSATNGIHVELHQGSVYEDFGVQSVQLMGLSAGASLSGLTPDANGVYTISPGYVMWLGSFLNLGGAASADFLLSVPIKLADGSVIERVAAVTASLENGQLVTRLKGVGVRDTFEFGAASWSSTTVTDGGAFFSKFLGRFGGSTEVSKTFTLPGDQTSVTISIDLYEIDSWDDEAFTIFVNGQQVARETFNVASDDSDHTGSTPLTLPANQGFGSHADQKHRFTFTVPVTGTSATIRVVSALNQAVSDESYGIDNVTVIANRPQAGDPILPRDLLAQFSNRDTLTNVENVVGTAYGDVFSGDAANNVFTSLDGNDYLQGNGGNDRLLGGAGDDTYAYNRGDGHDVVSDGSGVDRLSFSAGIAESDLVLTVGKLGDPADPASFRAALPGEFQLDLRIQILNQQTGQITGSVTIIDFRNASNANDLIRFANGNETTIAALLASRGITDQPLLLGTPGNDTLTGTAASEIFLPLGGSNTLSGGDGDDTFFVHGGSGSAAGGNGTDALDYLYANGAVWVALNGDDPDAYETTGPDYVESGLNYDLNSIENAFGSSFNDFLYGNNGVNLLSGRGGNDHLEGVDGNDTLYGGDGNDQLYGQGHDDTLYGGAGNDLLDGGSQIDAMLGGAGDDTYIVDNAGDIVTEQAGEGADTVQSSIAYTLTANVENLTLIGSSSVAATGNALANTITGNSGANPLDGGAGADVLVGGTGNDTYIVDGTDTVVELAAQGTDTVQSALSYTLGDNVENLILTGSAAVDGTGNVLANSITGNEAGNVLDGGAGNDTLIGGLGDDIYIVDSASDVVTEAASAGTDTVRASVTITALAGNVENLALTGSAALGGTGNTLDNTVTGNAADNALDGGTGADTLIGGLGNDNYTVDNAGDVVTEQVGEGWDTIYAGVTYTLAANTESIVLTGSGAINATGNALDNYLTGNSGVNILTGGSGNDVYIVQNTTDVVVELAGEGVDRVESSVAYMLAANVENLTLTGSASVAGTGNASNNTLIGNAGANTLDGGAGNDTMSGGAGNDTYIVDGTGDIVTELANEGTDTVQSSVDFTLGANVERLTLTGSAITAMGNVLDNIVTGNAGSNVLDGGAGNDTIYGGAGNDTIHESAGDNAIYGEDGDDIFYVRGSTGGIDGGAGTDTIDYLYAAGAVHVALNGDDPDAYETPGPDYAEAGLNYDLGSIENAGGSAFNDFLNGNNGVNILSGRAGNDVLYGVDGNDTLYGGDGNDQLYGQAHDDTLYGGAGNDLLDGGTHQVDAMYGGTGDDTYAVDNAGDVVSEAAGEGADTVQSSISFSLTSNVENLILTGSGAINATGNELENVLTGNGGANQLRGGGGNDRLFGGSGNDEYYWAVSEGHDIVLDSAGTDKIVFGAGIASSNLTLRVGVLNSQADPTSFSDTSLSASSDLRIEIRSAADNNLLGSITVLEYRNPASAADRVRYADGSETTLTALLASRGIVPPALVMGTAGDDQLTGTTANEEIRALAGNDTIILGGGNHVIRGGPGNDQIIDLGGLFGQTGNDTYMFAAGDGADIIGDVGGADSLVFEGSISPSDLWFARQSNNLVISRLGTADSVTVSNWFQASSYQVESIAAGGQNLTAAEVNSLISQIAAFSAQVGSNPSAVQPSDLPAEYHLAVNSVWSTS